MARARAWEAATHENDRVQDMLNKNCETAKIEQVLNLLQNFPTLLYVSRDTG